MQDQPRYEAYEAGDRKYFRDGKASRQLIEGTVPRVAPGQQYVDVQADYLYTGRSTAAGSALQQTTPQGAGQGAGGAQGAGGTSQAGAAQTGTQGVRANLPSADGTTTAGAQGGPDVFPVKIDAAAVERGQERYNIYCSMCHGMTGEGDGMIWRRGFRKPPSFFEDRLQEPTVSASHLFDVITNGWGAMPSYSDMIPAEDRWKIIAYVRAMQLGRKLKTDELPESERQRVREGFSLAPATGAHGSAAGEGGEGQPGQGDKNH